MSRSFLNPSPSPADSGHGDEYDEVKKLRQAYDELREKHNDKIEELLNNLRELNEKWEYFDQICFNKLKMITHYNFLYFY